MQSNGNAGFRENGIFDISAPRDSRARARARARVPACIQLYPSELSSINSLTFLSFQAISYQAFSNARFVRVSISLRHIRPRTAVRLRRARQVENRARWRREQHVRCVCICGCESADSPPRAILAKHSRREAPRMILGFSIGNYIRSTLISTPRILIPAGAPPISKRVWRAARECFVHGRGFAILIRMSERLFHSGRIVGVAFNGEAGWLARAARRVPPVGYATFQIDFTAT